MYGCWLFAAVPIPSPHLPAVQAVCPLVSALSVRLIPVRLTCQQYVIILSHMQATSQEEDLDPVWRALANPIRRKMLDLLRQGPRTTGDLAAEFPELSRFAVMQHLGVLEEAKLVVPRKSGRRRFNYLNPIPIQQMYQRWVSQFQRPWAESLVALKGELEGEAKDEIA